MQINNKIGWGIRIIFLWMIFSLHACCNDKEENEVIPICIASNHSLMALVPDFSIQTDGKSLEYPPNCSRLTQQDLIIRELEEKCRSWADS